MIEERKATNCDVKFAITYFSPIHPEMEICRRIEVAAQNIGVQCYFIGPNGIALQNGKHISELNVDFVLEFDPAYHCLFDNFIYHLLWFVPGLVSNQHAIPYRIFSDNCDDHLAFPSNVALNFYDHCYDTVNPVYLFPSVPRNYVLRPKPRSGSGEGKFRAFYAGINVDSKTVRHAKVFEYLDKHHLVDLYGPKEINGKKNWVGFSSYRGEIAFDGHSIMDAANKAGVTLALHHKVHASFSMPTNRIFEGLAAGTLVITDRMHFIEQEFGDTVFMLDSTLTQEEKAHRIHKIIDWANRNPEAATEKILAAQKIFMEKFELSTVIQKLCSQHSDRRQFLLEKSVSRCENKVVTVILEVYDDKALEKQIQNIFNQDYPYIKILAVIHEELTERAKKMLERTKERFAVEVIDAVEDNTYYDYEHFNLFRNLKPDSISDVFCFCAPCQYWHHNHIRSMLESMTVSNSFVAYSGSYYLNSDLTQCPLVCEDVLDLEGKLLSSFSEETTFIYNLFQIEFLRSSLLFSKRVLNLISNREKEFLYYYEHLGLLLATFIAKEKIVFSKKLTVFLQKKPNYENAEFDEQIYYKTVRNNPTMSFNSVQFIFSQVFAQNKKLEEALFNRRSRAVFDATSLVASQKNDLLDLKLKLRKYLLICFGVGAGAFVLAFLLLSYIALNTFL